MEWRMDGQDGRMDRRKDGQNQEKAMNDASNEERCFHARSTILNDLRLDTCLWRQRIVYFLRDISSARTVQHMRYTVGTKNRTQPLGVLTRGPARSRAG